MRVAPLFLAVFLPCIGVFFMYRREERRTSAANTPMIAIGGAIATKEEGLAHTAALTALADEVNELSGMIKDIIRRGDRRADIMERGVEELAGAKRALERLCHTIELQARSTGRA